ncbi:MAG: hypothetical protein WD595_00650 [Waddliaceae bacterium]
MTERPVSYRKATAVSNGVFLLALAVLFFTGWWWPGILLAIWAALGTKQYLMERYWDGLITSFILGGIFVASFFQLNWSMLMPAIFAIGGVYMIIREYYFWGDKET